MAAVLCQCLLLTNLWKKPRANLIAKSKVCILERGQWWISHEVPISAGGNELRKETGASLGMGEYLDSNNIPYHYWAFPDNVNGLAGLFSILRTVDRRGLYMTFGQTIEYILSLLAALAEVHLCTLM